MDKSEIDKKKKFLEERGWGTWYSNNYWVHPKTVEDRSRQDYTDYGMSLDGAYQFELVCPNRKIPPLGGIFKPLLYL